MKLFFREKKELLISIVLIILISFIVMMPIFMGEYKVGHDTKFHIYTIMSLTENIKNGIGLNILPNIAKDFGYGTNLFYPSLSHNITAYLNVLINNPILSLKIVYYFMLMFSGITMFFLSKKLSKNNKIGLISAVIYMLFPYHISNIYVRDAQAEVLLFVFLPLVISGLYDLYTNRSNFYYLFIIGYVGGMLSHLTMMVYFTVLVLLFMVINYKQTFKNIKKLIISSFFILSITSFFWIPLLEQKILGNYMVFLDGIMVQGTQNHGLHLTDYINYFTSKENNIKYYIDLVTLILLVITFIKYRKVNSKFYNYILIFGIIVIVLSSNLFFWDLLPKSFRMMQFPWRFETFVSLSVSLLAPLCLKLFKTDISPYICICLIIVSFPILNQESSEILKLSFDYSYGLGYQEEYLPVNTYKNKDYYLNRGNDVIVKDGTCDIIIMNNQIDQIEFKVSGSCIIELPRLYYVGYTLKQDNDLVNIYENENGFIESSLDTGIYNLKFTGTLIDKICKIVSIISIGGMLWLKKLVL